MNVSNVIPAKAGIQCVQRTHWTPAFDGVAGKRYLAADGQCYVQYVNRNYRRSGTLWEGCFRSCLLQEEGYLPECHRYIELNPVRAAMVEHPASYRWSSYRANAQGEASVFLKPHSLYEALGRNAAERLAA